LKKFKSLDRKKSVNEKVPDSRDGIPEMLNRLNLIGIGVELGVFLGSYSKIILEKSNLSKLYSVDAWAGDRGHNAQEYLKTIRALSTYTGRSIVLRVFFSEARELFDDESLDFVYIDGYAHNGQEGGATLRDWWHKIRPGGVFSGHDYHAAWPETVKQVDKFVKEHSLVMHTTPKDQFPSWYVIKAG
jgi:predicted O-methyltransferase YrrM